MRLQSFFLTVLISGAFVAAGCAEKADPKKPVQRIKKEVERMSVEELQSAAEAYAQKLRSQHAEVAKITERMKTISVEEIFSKKTKPIKDRFLSIQVESSALFQRYQIYINKLQEKGVDTSQIRID